MSASWYDVLGVEPDASQDEVRAAWKASIADLEPGDRRFRLYNNAAEVLLDADARAEYDDELGVQPAEREEPAEPEEPEDPEEPEGSAESEGPEESVEGSAEESEPGKPRSGKPRSGKPRSGKPRSGKQGRPVPVWLLAILAVALVGVAGFAFKVHHDTGQEESTAEAITEARQAAEDGMPLVFSYDYRHPEQDHDRAVRLLTGDQLSDYEQLWDDAILPNLKQSKGVVSSSTLRSGVVNTNESGDRVEILVVLGTKQANVTQQTDLTLPMTVTMVREDGTWLISDICAEGNCDGAGSSGQPSGQSSGQPSGQSSGQPSGQPSGQSSKRATPGATRTPATNP